MNHLRKRTNCPVEGHGTRCEAAQERRDDNRHPRTTEKRLAMQYEEDASAPEEQQ